MFDLRLIWRNNNWEVDSDASIPFDKLLLLAITRLESFRWTECTLNVALVELPRASSVFTAAIGISGGLSVNVGVFCILDIQSIMLATDDFGT